MQVAQELGADGCMGLHNRHLPRVQGFRLAQKLQRDSDIADVAERRRQLHGIDACIGNLILEQRGKLHPLGQDPAVLLQALYMLPPVARIPGGDSRQGVQYVLLLLLDLLELLAQGGMEPVVHLLQLPAGLVEAQVHAHPGLHHLRHKGLRDVVSPAQRKTLNDIFRIIVCGNEDNGDIFCLFIVLQCPAQLIAVHSRHGDVGQNQPGACLPDQLQRLFPAGRRHGTAAHVLNDLLQDASVRFQIVHNENPGRAFVRVLHPRHLPACSLPALPQMSDAASASRAAPPWPRLLWYSLSNSAAVFS